jgi:hypothetical protein
LANEGYSTLDYFWQTYNSNIWLLVNFLLGLLVAIDAYFIGGY